MPLYLILTAFTLTLAATIHSREPAGTKGAVYRRAALTGIGTALFLVSALRVFVGNDYYWYTDIMREAWFRGHVPTEAGFNLLVRTVYTLCGFQNYLLVFALFSLVTVVLFLYALSRYSECFALSFAMFLLLGYYFQSFSTVRYYAVLPLSFFALRRCEKKDVAGFLLIVLAGALFHKSILAVLLFYPLACMKWRKWMIVPAAAVCLTVALCPSFFTELAVRLYPTYRDVEFARGTVNLPNVLRCVLVTGFVFFVTRISPFEEKKETAGLLVWTKLSVMALLFYVSCWYLPQVSRIGYYLTLPQLLLVPAAVRGIEDVKKRRTATALVVLCCALYFVRYMMHAGDEGIMILPYRTFLFS